MIFRASFIKVGEIHTNSPLVYLLLDNNGVSQPFGIKDLLDSPCLFQLVDLFIYHIRMLLKGMWRLLLPRYYCRVYI